jgi:hypothetical protein
MRSFSASPKRLPGVFLRDESETKRINGDLPAQLDWPDNFATGIGGIPTVE